MKVKGAALEDVFDYFFHVGARKYLLENERDIFMNYLNDEIQRIFNLMTILVII